MGSLSASSSSGQPPSRTLSEEQHFISVTVAQSSLLAFLACTTSVTGSSLRDMNSRWLVPLIKGLSVISGLGEEAPELRDSVSS